MWPFGKNKKANDIDDVEASKFIDNLNRALIRAKQSKIIQELDQIDKALEEVLSVFESEMLCAAKSGYNYIYITDFVSNLTAWQLKRFKEMLEWKLSSRYGDNKFSVKFSVKSICVSLIS